MTVRFFFSKAIYLVSNSLSSQKARLDRVSENQVYFLGIEPNLKRVKLSHKLEYACRVLAQLALSKGQSKLAHIDALSEAEGIPANYLVQILNELRNAGLITSKRGKQGGYALAREPDKIGLTEIVEAVDPDLLGCKFEGSGHSGERVAEIWSEISACLEEKIGGYTLADIVVSGPGEMYYI
jgi:Rrf2 family protein